MKRCPECDKTKPRTEFYADGRSTYCRPCTKIIGRRATLRQYGLSEEQFAQMLAEQNGCCCICRTALDDVVPHVDHDHDTERVRGVLCGRCNRTIGLFGDDARRLRNAAAYLRSYAQ